MVTILVLVLIIVRIALGLLGRGWLLALPPGGRASGTIPGKHD